MVMICKCGVWVVVWMESEQPRAACAHSFRRIKINDSLEKRLEQNFVLEWQIHLEVEGACDRTHPFSSAMDMDPDLTPSFFCLST